VIVLALSGPKGWIALAGAAAIAAGGIAALNSQFGQYNSELAKAQKGQQAVTDGAETMQAAMTGPTDFQARMNAMIEEFRILRGETTAFELELEKLSKAGATPAMLENLRVMNEERERLLGLQDEERKKQQQIASEAERAAAAVEQQKAAMQSEAESIIQSLKNPAQRFLDRQAEIEALQANGLLNESQASRAIEMARRDILDSATQAEAQRPQAMQAGSQEAFRTILQAMGKQDPQVQAVNKMNQNLAKKMDGMTDAILTIQTAGVA
jgi:hypothetical protein